MKFISSLTLAQSQELRELHKNGSSHRVLQRAHAVLLSAKGYSLAQLADIFDLDRDTISEWLHVWEQQGSAALGDAAKPGRPSKLDQVIFPWIRGQYLCEVSLCPALFKLDGRFVSES